MSDIIARMVTFCTGSARKKRAYFEEASGVTVLDNVEVLFCSSENGMNYFAFGEVPFASFTVDDYLKYRRALNVGEISANIDVFLRRQKLSGLKKLKRISPVQMRIVNFLEKTAGVTDKAVVINLDGTKYSRRLNKQLKRFIAALNVDVFVCVTDNRFIVKANNGYKTMTFGAKNDGTKPKFTAARKLAKRVRAKRVAIF